MEKFTFPSAAVAAELVPNFVEARLHTDGRVNIDRIQGLQRDLAGTVANPYYVVVDPATGERLGEGPYMSAQKFAQFLQDARS
ncbi:hypothetical protein [Engelhardtia mirabilis]|uniref:Uncharacterized protein n=2 Tax=Engelhardtia mirabilis TaxID=2528011 RepID=A0A518BSZ8_9BACT|nr:hypothetical protein Pla133_52160 [Planctomycetes bacterium Pla133]QDV04418.1 hypothetical protein Pla86_52130 [Planctomycetes bacterium Pla86]